MKHIKFLMYLTVMFLFVSCGGGSDSSNPDPVSTTPPISTANNTKIEAVFLAQTHVLSPSDDLFKLVGNRDALLKVQVIDPGAITAPIVTVDVKLQTQSETLTLSGPSNLPTAFDSTLGSVVHSFDDSFTVLIPAQWVQPGLSIDVKASEQTLSFELDVGAPNKINMNMFDVHYFGLGTRAYPQGTFDELQEKWPISSFSLERARSINFLEMVIPARPDVGAPNVRVTSTAEYQTKTGLRFDGEQAAALQWVEALSASGGNQDTAMCYINIIGVPAGGQAGGFDGVGAVSVGILNHELGHSLSLPHWGDNAAYPYKGDMHGITAPDVLNGTHVGPTWAFDIPTMSFIPPTVQATQGRWIAGTYKASPMQGGGTGDQEPVFLMRHFSDYSVNQMQHYIESKVAVERNGDWFKWNDTDKDYTNQINNLIGIRYPVEQDVQVISVMAATSLSDMDVNMVYSPIGPYEGNLILRFDPANAADRTRADTDFCPNSGCDFTLRVTQGGVISDYMLAASGNPAADNFNARESLKTAAVNLPASQGDVSKVELLLTPDAEKNGLPTSPQILDTFESVMSSFSAFNIK